ncbi:phosphatidylserine synthase 2, partial [Plakobranchus ocellatus]
NCKKFGRQSWIIAAIIITEFLISLKFDWKTMTKPIPTHMAVFWVVGLLGLIVWTVIKFYVFKDVKHDIPEKDSLKVKSRNGGGSVSHVPATFGDNNNYSPKDEEGEGLRLRSRKSLRKE